MLSYIIRCARPEDARAIAAVAQRTWAATYQNIIPEAIQIQALAQWYSEDRLAQAITSPAGAFVVATAESGQIVGFANASPRRDPGHAELWRFYVLPEHQRKGLGRHLVRASLDALLADRHLERVFVQVETENEIGRRAYEALGFKYIREYDDELLGHVTRMSEMCLAVATQ